ncbi:MAG TPA: DNA polymerase ligase N-terminal domain-containing protein [Oceanipulchritudo sp.]|nr:DNA polymerase ligase N-terminal domain-containing protein [Oceanipulchritudo sp.]
MALKTYHRKRNADQTPEPPGQGDKGDPGRIFVIQKHDASQLHYDFRIRTGDVLASWAVPKGPSTAANEKRLAMRTEDHPLEYADFEGVIPEDEYGGGTVMIWDRGTYEPLDGKDPRQALEEGSLKFRLNGDKVSGGYAIVRTRRDGDEEQWMLFKLADREADARRNPVSTEPDSVASGRSMEEIRKTETDDD